MTETVMMVAKPLAAEIKAQVAVEASGIFKATGVRPKLVALLIGKDPVSRVYVDLKQKDCGEVGISSEVIDLSSSNSSPSEIIETIKRLNEDPSVNAVIPQMPFSGVVSEERVFSTLSSNKDADGLSPFRLGKLARGEYRIDSALLPCTPKGVILLCRHYCVPIKGADVAIVGRSTLVGEPLRKLFQDLDATATCYHTKSKNVSERIKTADIVVAASGRPPEIYGETGFRVGGDSVRSGSTVVSVGVRKDEAANRMLFDVDTSALKGKVAFLTPNTGGVGVMTRACLLQNTINATKIQSGSR